MIQAGFVPLVPGRSSCRLASRTLGGAAGRRLFFALQR